MCNKETCGCKSIERKCNCENSKGNCCEVKPLVKEN